MLLKCRALGNTIKTKQSHNLIKSLLNLVSNLPELESQFAVLTEKKTGDFYFEAVQTGLKVCDDCVLLTALAHTYLEAAHKVALNLLAHLFQRFYRQRVRPQIDFQIEKVKHVCRGFVARKSWAKKRLAVIKIQSVVRMFVIKSHFDYERQILRGIIRAQAVWRGKVKRHYLHADPPTEPGWRLLMKQQQEQRKQGQGVAMVGFLTPTGERNYRHCLPQSQHSQQSGYSTGYEEGQFESPVGEQLDYTPYGMKSTGGTGPGMRGMVMKSYTTEEEDSRSNDEEEEHVEEEDERPHFHTNPLHTQSSSSSSSSYGPEDETVQSPAKLKELSDLQAQLDAMKAENKALRKVEKQFIHIKQSQSQSLSMNHDNVHGESKEYEDEEDDDDDGDDHQRLGNRSGIIHRQNTENDLQAEKLRCAYDADGTRLLPDYDLYSARVLNAVQDDLSYLLKPTVFYKVVILLFGWLC